MSKYFREKRELAKLAKWPCGGTVFWAEEIAKDISRNVWSRFSGEQKASVAGDG